MSVSPTPQPDWSQQPPPPGAPPPPGWSQQPPPGGPPPPGAQPVPGWSQPPAPPGAPPDGRRRTGWLVGGIAAGVALLLVGVGIVIALLTGSDRADPLPGPGPGAITPPAAESPAPPAAGPIADILADGSGPETIELDLPPGTLAIATIVHQPVGEFDQLTFFLIDDEGQEQVYYSATGTYFGTHLLGDVPPGFGSMASLRVDGSGTWSIHIQDIGHAPAWPVTEGDHTMVVRIEPGTLTGPVPVTAEHEGYFSVGAYLWAGNPTGDDFLIEEQLVVEFDAGTSSFELPEDTVFLRISADNNWTIDLS